MPKCDVSNKGDVASNRREYRRARQWLRFFKWTRRFLFTCGLPLLAVYGVVRLESCVGSRAALRSFEALLSPVPMATGGHEEEISSPEADVADRTENRVHAYKETFSNQFSAPLAVLQIPKIHLAVPLLEGVDELTLNHAVGRIPGTARLWEQGNLGIAGHRDGFFRRLKDVNVGDDIELKTREGTDTYVVDRIQIVKPDDIGVLKPGPIPSLTLVTCYPFYFVGNAPKRFVVTANLTQPKQLATHTR